MKTRVALGLLCCALGLAVQGALAAPRNEICDEIRQILRAHSLNTPSEAALASLSGPDLDASLRQIDPHARLFAAHQYQAPGASTAMVGIGAELGSGPLLFVHAHGPADRAGVPDRSRLLRINGQDVHDRDIRFVAELLTGKKGQPVRLTVLTPKGIRQDFHVLREAFTPLSVETIQAGRCRALKIRDIVSGQTRSALRATLEFFSRTNATSAHANEISADPLVVDLRDALGGDLYEALDMAGLFLPPDTLLATIRDRSERVLKIHAPIGKKYAMPLVLLVGPDTASAAEIFAGILQQHGRAMLVGQKTYGKCSSQTDTTLSDGSVLRYTNKEVLLPMGDTCSGTGLAPNKEVKNAQMNDLKALVEQVCTFGVW